MSLYAALAARALAASFSSLARLRKQLALAAVITRQWSVRASWLLAALDWRSRLYLVRRASTRKISLTSTTCCRLAHGKPLLPKVNKRAQTARTLSLDLSWLILGFIIIIISTSSSKSKSKSSSAPSSEPPPPLCALSLSRPTTLWKAGSRNEIQCALNVSLLECKLDFWPPPVDKMKRARALRKKNCKYKLNACK